MALERLLSVKEAAAALGGVSVWTIRAWLSRGVLRRTKVGGRTMITESELSRFLMECAAKAKTSKGRRHGRR
jgi:excisionase family DNA binding protein